MIDRYDWAGGQEAMLRFGPATGPVVIMALPLFEEANRTRAFAVALLRALAGLGIAGALPDLPGMGESVVETARATLDDWRAAFAAAAHSLGRPVHVAALRGGALVTGAAMAASHWQFAPVAGAALVRDLLRARLLAAPEDAAIAPFAEPDGPPVELLGNLVSRALLAALAATEPANVPTPRVVRLEGDPGPADLRLPGAPLWRRSEPGNDPALAHALAADLAAWIAPCGA